MVGDHEDRAAAEDELARERLAAVRSRPRSAGSIRPGETVSCALPRTFVTPTAVVASPPARSVKETRCGLKRKTWRMLPPGSPPSLSFDRVDGAPVVRRAARRHDRVDQLLHRLVGGDRAVVRRAVVVLDLLQGHDVGRLAGCSRSRRRGRRTVASDGSRFSTLYVATASSPRDCLRVVSRSRPPFSRVPSWLATSV